MTTDELRLRFERDLREEADRSKTYIHFDRRSDGEYQEPVIRLAYAAFLSGVAVGVEGVDQCVST